MFIIHTTTKRHKILTHSRDNINCSKINSLFPCIARSICNYPTHVMDHFAVVLMLGSNQHSIDSVHFNGWNDLKFCVIAKRYIGLGLFVNESLHCQYSSCFFVLFNICRLLLFRFFMLVSWSVFWFSLVVDICVNHVELDPFGEY